MMMTCGMCKKKNTAGGVRGVGDDVNDDTRTPVRED